MRFCVQSVKTMKIFLPIFICWLHGINCIESSLTKYLDDRAKSVGEKLIRNVRNEVKLNDVNNFKLMGNYSRGEMFILFNTPYALLDQELYQISQKNITLVHRFSLKENIIFLKSKEFETLGFVSFATKTNTLHIFGIRNDTLSFFKIQNIIYVNIIDAEFFEYRNELYLVTASYRSSDLTSVIIYKFINSHFDEVQHFLTSSATKICTFDNNGSEILVILQKFGMTSTLYEFKNGQFRKIQKFNTDHPEQILDFLHEKQQYGMLFSETNSVNIYLWTGTELLFWEEFNTPFKLTGKKSIFYVNEDPYLVSTNNTYFVIFGFKNNQFTLINSSVINSNWINIWTFVTHTNMLVILGSTKENMIEISTMSITIQADSSKQHVLEKTKLANCFANLEKSVYSLRNKLTNFENSASTLREADGGRLHSRKLEKLRKNYAEIKATTKDLKLNNLIINNSAEVDIPISAKKVTAKDIRFEELNSQKWQPERWLSYSSPQTITESVKAQLIQVDNLQTKNQSLFKDLLLSKGNQVLSGSVDINYLECNYLKTKFLNEIPVENFYYKSEPVKILGHKFFTELKAENLNTASINGNEEAKIIKFITNQPYDFDYNLKVDNLWIENINGINFENFRNSVFRIGIVDTIDGNLTFINLKTNQMIFETVSKKSNILTTTSDQTINSSITISKILANNIKTDKTNGINFKNSIATFEDKLIIGAVSIKNLNIARNLELTGNVSSEFLQFNDTHIVGTNESDFLQRYNGHVKIKGNLILKNFNLGKSAKMLLSGTEFDTKIDQFWTKSTQQEVPKHFEAQNGISTPHLLTVFINDFGISDYLLNSTQPRKTTKFYFDNVTIKENIFLNPGEQHSPDLQRIQQDSVKINGTFKIKGHKTFSNILKVDDLEFENVLPKFLNKKDSDLSGLKKNQYLFIAGDLHSKLIIETVNNISLQEVAENVICVDKPQNLSELIFKNVTAQNVFVTTMNDYGMNDLIEKFNLIDKTEKIYYVYIDNNVTIKNIQDLSTINNQDVNYLLHRSLSKYNNKTVFGDVKFLGNIIVKDLYIIQVNDVNLQKLSQQLLYRSWNQTIRKPFIFYKLYSENIITDQINNVHVTNLIDVASTKLQKILTPNGFKMADPVKIRNLNGEFGCDINESLKKLRNPMSQFWDNVLVTGNVTFWDKNSLVGHIFDEVVTQERTNHVIKNKVTFIDHISVNNITAMKNINDVDIMKIVEDAFLNTPDIKQIVTGKKTFAQLECQVLAGIQNTDVSSINDIKLFEINNKIISKNSFPDVPIKGEKIFFGGLQTTQIETGLLLGVESKNLVTSESIAKIPRAMFENIAVVDNFNIKFINSMPFEVFLTERLFKKSTNQILTGNYFFRNVSILGDISISQINNIKMEAVIYDIDLQTIESPKKILKDLRIVGDMSTELINGLKLSESYEKAVLQNEKPNFTGRLFIMKPALIKGNIQTKYINNVPMEYILDTTYKYSVQSEAQQIYKITKIISDFVHDYLNITIRMPNELLYLEKSTILQISLPDTINAQVVQTKDGILIHVESEEDGYICGLPQTCKCPVQQTMQISSEHSVNMFINKAMQRIYTYYDEDIIVHFITHSISTNSVCRTDKGKLTTEVSSLTWNKPPQGDNSGGFFVYRGIFNGYISGVKFFTTYGITYIVIAIYYDPFVDTHNVDSRVLRFNKDKTALEEIQRIPTVGVKTIALFPTSQGVVLIMGHDISVQFRSTNTKIFRFDDEKQEFEVLREVPSFRSLFAEGVVLGTDSLIILANEYSTLNILKYQVEFDNYYFYQSFQLDYPVSSMSVFYAGGFGISDVYLNVVTTYNKFLIYSFQFIEGWKLESSGELEGIKSLVPFKLKKKYYLFAPSSNISSLITFVEHDSD